MKQTTQEMLDRIEESHDWQPGGTWGHGGAKLTRTDKCRVCCIERTWYHDGQSGKEDEWSFIDRQGKELTLVEASKCN